jgi:hypothetical protein
MLRTHDSPTNQVITRILKANKEGAENQQGGSDDWDEWWRKSDDIGGAVP